eukprot:Nitzschia sp. Nitz4//scaffold73_size107353//68874//70280//NITZ4_004326-RA/size107353-processed-gene-0.11-mRNA-1//1//CDS//3329557494//7492//frame0
MAATATEPWQEAVDGPAPPKPLNVVFIHLDLGIGGAEQLVLQLATATQALSHNVQLITTRCDEDHCFQAVGKGGRLADNVTIYGNWIPASIMGVGTAIMSILRIFFLTWQVCWNHRDADIVVVDVLPTSLPLLWLLLPSAATLFYCHFPDKLLLRTTGGMPKQLYRMFVDSLEEVTMGVADMLVVNSKFTLNTVRKTFSTLDPNISVLYPALDTTLEPNNQPKTPTSPIVSLNRFERKKNIGLLIRAYHFLKENDPSVELPPLIIAGGYDKQNVENVEYRAELQKLADNLQVPVEFLLDVSDEKRTSLFQTALCVVYTPDQEHFGIVPLEAMYAGSPVLAVNSGGPTETVVDGKCGFLRPPFPEAFGSALLELVQDPSKATTMGRDGRRHVEQKFGAKRLQKEWKGLLDETIQRRDKHRPNYSLWKNTGKYTLEAIFTGMAVVFLTAIMKIMGFSEESGGLMDKLKQK